MPVFVFCALGQVFSTIDEIVVVELLALREKGRLEGQGCGEQEGYGEQAHGVLVGKGKSGWTAVESEILDYRDACQGRVGGYQAEGLPEQRLARLHAVPGGGPRRVRERDAVGRVAAVGDGEALSDHLVQGRRGDELVQRQLSDGDHEGGAQDLELAFKPV